MKGAATEGTYTACLKTIELALPAVVRQRLCPAVTVLLEIGLRLQIPLFLVNGCTLRTRGAQPESQHDELRQGTGAASQQSAKPNQYF